MGHDGRYGHRHQVPRMVGTEVTVPELLELLDEALAVRYGAAAQVIAYLAELRAGIRFVRVSGCHTSVLREMLQGWRPDFDRRDSRISPETWAWAPAPHPDDRPAPTPTGRPWEPYGLSLDDYEAMLARQQGCCALCGRRPWPGRPLQVDHDHQTGRVRGLLCGVCNSTLTRFEDETIGWKNERACDDEWCARARAYLDGEELL